MADAVWGPGLDPVLDKAAVRHFESKLSGWFMNWILDDTKGFLLCLWKCYLGYIEKSNYIKIVWHRDKLTDRID